jgi:hypothetical protein
MVGSNKKHGVNRRHQRGGTLSLQNVADQVIYPYMHDKLFPPYQALPKYNTLEIKLFVANNINNIRHFLVAPKNLTIFTTAAFSAAPGIRQKFIEFGNHLYDSCHQRFDAQLKSLQNDSTSPSPLPLGWISANNNQYVNIFTNEAQSVKPTREADSGLWSVNRQDSLAAIKRPTLTSVRPTLTADKTNIIEGETVTITPTYGNSATLMVTVCNPPIIANSDINESAENKENGLNAEYSGIPFTYDNLPPGKYVLRLIEGSTESEPLTITVEPKSSGKGGKTRGHKRRASKRTRKH